MKATERHSEIVTGRPRAAGRARLPGSLSAPQLRGRPGRSRGRARDLDVEGSRGGRGRARPPRAHGDDPRAIRLLLDAVHNPAGARRWPRRYRGGSRAAAVGLPGGARRQGRRRDSRRVGAATRRAGGDRGPRRAPGERGAAGARALEADALAGAAREAGVGGVEAVADPVAAVARARSRSGGARQHRARHGGSHTCCATPPSRSEAPQALRNSLTSPLSQSVWSLRQPCRSLK